MEEFQLPEELNNFSTNPANFIFIFLFFMKEVVNQHQPVHHCIISGFNVQPGGSSLRSRTNFGF